MSKNWRIWQERPYNDDSIASRLLSEVKHRLAWLVLRWGTTLESQVLFFCNLAFAGQPPYHTHINYIFIHDSICTTHGRYTAPKIHPVWYFLLHWIAELEITVPMLQSTIKNMADPPMNQVGFQLMMAHVFWS